jgi:hypothetical protein
LWQDKEFCTTTYSKKDAFKYKKAMNKTMNILLILLHTFFGDPISLALFFSTDYWSGGIIRHPILHIIMLGHISNAMVGLINL